MVGVVFNPVSNECFTAVRGSGAYLNGGTISVSDATDLGCALVATEVGVTRDAATVAAILDRISKVRLTAVTSRKSFCTSGLFTMCPDRTVCLMPLGMCNRL